ncbi:MAG: PadR family transcriptional regulator [Saccharofermentans sp.]|nr:PadR family transcriptional regulator [Saccharofermentans sp.]
MLSKTSIVILGMLRKGEMNAYDMLKMIDRMNMKYWFPIGATTLYETCLRLEKKNCIENTGESDKKAVYKLTEAGMQELKDTVCALFERVDFDSVWFCLAVMYSGVLSKKELAREIGIRRKLLDEYEKGTLENKKIMLKYDVSYIEVCAIDRMLQIIRMEKETLENFAKQAV